MRDLILNYVKMHVDVMDARRTNSTGLVITKNNGCYIHLNQNRIVRMLHRLGLKRVTKPMMELILLHELGHYIIFRDKNKLDYDDACFDESTIEYETELGAWQHARVLAKELGVRVNEKLIKVCLDTYKPKGVTE